MPVGPALISATWHAAAAALSCPASGLPSRHELHSKWGELCQPSSGPLGQLTAVIRNGSVEDVVFYILAHLLLERVCGEVPSHIVTSDAFNPILFAFSRLYSGELPISLAMPCPPMTSADIESHHTDHVTDSSATRPCLVKCLAEGQTCCHLILTDCNRHSVNALRSMHLQANYSSAHIQTLTQHTRGASDDSWLTIVIPTLRTADTQEAIASIVSQKGAGGLVILVISADQNRITREQASNDVVLITIPSFDTGPYDAMNLGLFLTQTPWVFFLGSDDQLASGDVLGDVRVLTTELGAEVKIIYGNVEMQGAGNGTYDKQIYSYEFDYDRLRHQTPCHQSIFYTTDSLKTINGYTLEFPVCADWHANIRLWRQCNPKFIDVVVAKFARGGISSQIYDDRFFSSLESLWLENK